LITIYLKEFIMGRKKRRIFLAALVARNEKATGSVNDQITDSVTVVAEVVVEQPVPVVEVQEPVVEKPVAKVTKAVKAK
jgi:hypothetical protein